MLRFSAAASSPHQRRRRDCCLSWPAAQSGSHVTARLGGPRGRWFVRAAVCVCPGEWLIAAIAGPSQTSIGTPPFLADAIVSRSAGRPGAGLVDRRHCDRPLPGGARRKGIVAVADAARSRPVETNRPVEAVVAPQLKPDGGRSRLLSRRSRAGTDAAVRRHAVPRADVTVLGQRLPLRLAKRSPCRRELGRCRCSSKGGGPERGRNCSGATAAARPMHLDRCDRPTKAANTVAFASVVLAESRGSG